MAARGVPSPAAFVPPRTSGWCRRDGADLVLAVRVQPRASREGFAGTVGDAVKIALLAPPVGGRANEALRGFLAKEFGVPKSAVVLERGEGARRKRVRILAPKRIPAALAAPGTEKGDR